MTDASGSGYGRNAIVPSEDATLTHVEFGTPMGELLRRYWQPVCLSSELTDLPKFLKILGEDPPGTFRDPSNRVMKNLARNAVLRAETEAAPH